MVRHVFRSASEALDIDPLAKSFAMVYVHRFLNDTTLEQLPYPCAFGLIVTSYLLASKFLEDQNIWNVDFAECAEVTLQKLNLMEMVLLHGLRFRLLVTEDHLDLCYDTLSANQRSFWNYALEVTNAK